MPTETWVFHIAIYSQLKIFRVAILDFPDGRAAIDAFLQDGWFDFRSGLVLAFLWREGEGPEMIGPGGEQGGECGLCVRGFGESVPRVMEIDLCVEVCAGSG